MPVMKRLTVDGVNYDTVGEASVTQTLTSGTEIATVTIDGAATKLYAPEGGGGGPEPSSTTPAMDGTAAVGTATTYARADHVHPTDTSRQATLVSGTNIKTINGNSLLGAGDLPTRELPYVTSADNGKVLMVVGGIWQVTSLPLASDSAFGVVKVDGTTITATNGIISTDGGGATSYEVTITLTNPRNSGEFQNCHIFQSVSSDYYPEDAEEVGVITSPTGNVTVTVSMPYINIRYHGMAVALGTVTCTGGVSLVTTYDGVIEVYQVTGDGTIVSDGVDYDD